jgi:hypothetical protein
MKKAYLVSLTLVLSLMGIAFLAAPATYLGTLGVQVSDHSVMGTIRSFGGFYLGFAAFLLLASSRVGGADLAVSAAVLALAGLIAGRATGFVADGSPDRSLLAAAAVELVFAAWGLVILVRRRVGKS